MKRTIQVGTGLAVGGLAAMGARQWRKTHAEQERAKLEKELLAALAEVEAEINRLHAEFETHP